MKITGIKIKEVYTESENRKWIGHYYTSRTFLFFSVRKKKFDPGMSVKTLLWIPTK
jgi:hypothetical protein